MSTNEHYSNENLSLTNSFCLLLLVIFCQACATQKPTTNCFSLGDVVPNGKTIVEIVDVRYGKRVEELSLKMNQALVANKIWWMEYIKKHASDYPLPYDPKCGLTQTEYAEYLNGVENKGHLHKVDDAYLTFRRKGDFVSIDPGDDSSPVAKWRLNILTKELLLPSGESLKPVWQSKKDEKQPIGAFEGYSWDYDNPSETPSNCHIASLNIFRLKPSGMIFWRIKEGEIRNDQPVERFDIAFRYAPERVK